ncbi:hypothetical protein [Stakelama tenebrarum]|uniref:Uncharacterized protein n=1 Tax=Stakelama tenebrarum TaxID=2711215 RepID=A0A6G6Y509_9SPHN|nr:hypothetical protein [Sphingosinithalassobacter tenebrarum]QIG79990.1 hypothetical protein G5C33_09515 [Sphingosinithalassobacter tenebrarum]
MTLYRMQSSEPEWITLIPAEGKRVAVEVLAHPATRAIRRKALASIAQDADGGGEPEAGEGVANEIEDFERKTAIGEAYGAAMIRARVSDWRGLADPQGRKVPIGDASWEMFLADDALFTAAYARLVVPVLAVDAEKNGSSPSPNGIGAGAMPENNIAGTNRAAPRKKGGARNARTASTRRRATKAKPSGA